MSFSCYSDATAGYIFFIMACLLLAVNSIIIYFIHHNEFKLMCLLFISFDLLLVFSVDVGLQLDFLLEKLNSNEYLSVAFLIRQ